MTLKEQAAADLELFFDLDEFAELHTLAGRKLTVVIDNDQLQKNTLKAPGGTFDGDLLLYAKSADLKRLKLEPQRVVVYDGLPYLVCSSAEQDGVTQLILQTHRGF